MQGRITKVLNMKPPEILGMIEEAAGTMMYESKKLSAIKTIEKKDAKLREINNILKEEITPTLTKLKEERNTYLEYQKLQRQLDHLTKLWIAYKYTEAEESAKNADKELEKIKQEIEDLEASIERNKLEMEEISKTVEELQRKRDEELGGRLEELEAILKEKEQALIKLEQAVKAVKDNISQEERKKKTITKGMNTDKKALDEKQKQFDGVQEMYDALRTEAEAAQEALKAAQARFEAISVGKFSSEDGKAATLQEQLIALRNERSEATTSIKTSDMKLKHHKKELKDIQTKMKNTAATFAKDSANLKKYEDAVTSAQKQMDQLQYQPGRIEELEERRQRLNKETYELKMDARGASVSIDHLQFDYNGKSKEAVHDTVAQLLRVKDDMFFSALDAAGGGKLSNVVVESSKDVAIISKQNLERRVIFLPLDKVAGKEIPGGVLKKAQSLVGKENVWRALDLVSYDRKFHGVMAHVFGNILICRTVEMANKVAFCPEVNRVCVTLLGDTVNPGGTLSGGAPTKGGSALRNLAELRRIQSELQPKDAELEQVTKELDKLNPLEQEYKQLSHALEMKTRELERVRSRLGQTDHAQMKADEEKLVADISDLEEAKVNAKTIEVENSKKEKEIEYKIKHAKELKEKELKEADAAVKKCKKNVEASKQKWSAKEGEEASLKLELETLRKSIEDAEEQLQAILDYEGQMEKLHDDVQMSKDNVSAAKDEVKSQKDAVARNNKEISSQVSRREKLQKQNTDGGLKLQELGHLSTKKAEEARNAESVLQRMRDQHDFITADVEYFGKAGSVYDFSTMDPKETKTKLTQLEEQKEKLEHSVNMRAMAMLDKAETQYKDVMHKKVTVEQDKVKIQKVIEELDRKKKDELRKAHEKVNKDFGSIFSTLLPGANAKLRPPDGMDVIDGLEVKVAFGDVWKESLAELSGGQRSLVALSLILSLLLFKPAPLYILDEVDAALDLSHTQNIGRMLKQHFRHSQFIVVSLKDGMFSNANVLFKTKFVDGMSTVTRTTNKAK